MAKKQPKITVIERDISDLIFAEYNPRQMTADQKQHLTDSMKRFGFVDPIIINTHEKRSNVIIGGHQRVRIAKELGITSIPCVELSLDINEEKELNIRLNKNTGEWDFDALANYFEVSDLIEWGFDEKELNFDVEAQEGLTDDDAIPEVTEPTCKPGDLWILGDHRLLCGDATISTDVDKLMDGEKADMVFTDPPYGMNLDAEGFAKMPKAKGTTAHEYKNIIGDGSDFTPDLITSIFMSAPNAKEVFIWGADYFAELLPDRNDGSLIVWDKRQEGGTDKLFGSSFEICWSKERHKRDIARILWAGYFGMSSDDTKQRVHPTQKPTELAVWFFDRWGSGLITVLDLFLGSGSTLIACEKTNRKCYGMELDPHYCDVIVKRWEDFTGKKAELG